MNSFKDFINKEAASGLLLIVFAIAAFVISNSSLAPQYRHFLDIIFTVSLNDAGVSKPILLWINDGLMAVFFFLIGLELKREVLAGELRHFDKALLPIAGAIGGMFFPAAVFLWITWGENDITHAWAIPMATDIAFALGILALFGKRVPSSLKLFLMTLAIIDDLGAILVIALFHTADLSWLALGLASACFVILLGMNRGNVSNNSPYMFIGAIMWLCVLKSGFHATLAGVLLAATIPLETKDGRKMLVKLEHDLHPVVAFFILPLFAFANAGVPLAGMSLNSLGHPLIVGIVAGLVVGKIVGIFFCTVFAKKVFRAQANYTNIQMLGTAALCGIGFTMSLFIAGLSFGNNEMLLNYSRLGIICGSLISMVIGVLVLAMTLPKAQANFDNAQK